MKIMVMGYSGGGKSTLARTLGRRYGCPVLHLDQINFLPGWQERDRGEANRLLERFLDENPSWVIDGNYLSLGLKRRLEEADRIVFLALPALTCLRRVIARWRGSWGRVRLDMAEGCPEKLDLGFLWWVVWAGRDPAHRRKYRSVLEPYRDKLTVVRGRKQAAVLEEKEAC